MAESKSAGLPLADAPPIKQLIPAVIGVGNKSKGLPLVKEKGLILI